MKLDVLTFSKAAIAALAATVVDFGTLTIWVEVLHQFYPIGVALGAAFGAITNFSLNRHWAFDAAHAPVGKQAVRYGIVSLGSLCLNTGGVWLVTEKLHLFYMISKIVVALMVGFLFNYPLQRRFVYPKLDVAL
jgi:putative flippase GtrA